MAHVLPSASSATTVTGGRTAPPHRPAFRCPGDAGAFRAARPPPTAQTRYTTRHAPRVPGARRMRQRTRPRARIRTPRHVLVTRRRGPGGGGPRGLSGLGRSRRWVEDGAVGLEIRMRAHTSRLDAALGRERRGLRGGLGVEHDVVDVVKVHLHHALPPSSLLHCTLCHPQPSRQTLTRPARPSLSHPEQERLTRPARPAPVPGPRPTGTGHGSGPGSLAAAAARDPRRRPLHTCRACRTRPTVRPPTIRPAALYGRWRSKRGSRARPVHVATSSRLIAA